MSRQQPESYVIRRVCPVCWGVVGQREPYDPARAPRERSDPAAQEAAWKTLPPDAGCDHEEQIIWNGAGVVVDVLCTACGRTLAPTLSMGYAVHVRPGERPAHGKARP